MGIFIGILSLFLASMGQRHATPVYVEPSGVQTPAQKDAALLGQAHPEIFQALVTAMNTQDTATMQSIATQIHPQYPALAAVTLQNITTLLGFI